jgi:glycosyltransferase involved in cell wall biosynthesis
MLNLTMVVAEMGAGGAEAVVGTLARELLVSGAGVTVASNGGWRANELSTAGARLVRLRLDGRHPARLLRAAATLRRELRRYPPAIIHSHNVKAALVARLACSGLREHLPHVTTLHGLDHDAYPAAARILSRCVDSLVAVSDDVAIQITRAGFPDERVSVVENGVPPIARHGRTESRTRLSIQGDAPVAVCIARLAPQKRHDLLIQAWRAMPPHALLLIAGDGERRASVASAVADAGLSDQVRLLGERRDVDWLLAAADLCVLPTDWEGLPVTVLESMSVGVPVVASAVSGINGTFSGAAHLVVAGSSAALAGGMIEVIENAEYRQFLIRAGAHLVSSRFSVDAMVGRYREVYERSTRRTIGPAVRDT